MRIRGRMLAAETQAAAAIAALPRDRQASGRNLIQYCALRRHDLRPLQARLAAAGLSSLGHCEAHTLASVDRLLVALGALTGSQIPGPSHPPPVDATSGPARLARHAAELLGPSRTTRDARIMVTLDGEAVRDGRRIPDLLAAGVDLVRINAAHNAEPVWKAIIDQVRLAERGRGRRCLVLLDLPGPKLRTGAVAAGDPVVHWHAHRDALGGTARPARIALIAHPAAADPSAAPAGQAAPLDAVVPVTAAFLAALAVGDAIVLRDRRGKRRALHVIAVEDGRVLAETEQGASIEPGIELRLRRRGRTLRRERLHDLPAREPALILQVADQLLLTDGSQPGAPAEHDASGGVARPASIPCSIPAVLADLHVGHRIWFDDGAIGGVVREASPSAVRIAITHAPDGGAKLRSGKGINCPDSQLALPCLSDEDHRGIAFARRHADLIGQSFLRSADDVRQLASRLGRGRRRPGMILKIETQQAFAQLPAILMAGLAAGPLGVMVARGDLAVEVGFARLAEVQEEILWLCEAAHLPVVWGTQVLETLVKKGIATRAEVTDAAMSGRAECVMLNKGAHLIEAVRFLDDVLARMRTHQSKKRSLLRRLAISVRSRIP